MSNKPENTKPQDQSQSGDKSGEEGNWFSRLWKKDNAPQTVTEKILAAQRAAAEAKKNEPEIGQKVEPEKTPGNQGSTPEAPSPQTALPDAAAKPAATDPKAAATPEIPAPQQEKPVAETKTNATEPSKPSVDTPKSETQIPGTKPAAQPEVKPTEKPAEKPGEKIGEKIADKTDTAKEDKKTESSWFERLKEGLRKSTNAISDGIASIFTKKKIDDDTLEELEDLLITTDLGVNVAAKLTGKLAEGRYNKEISGEEVKKVLSDEIKAILAPCAKPLDVNTGHKPHIILTVGVNGAGKTTTIGKLAKKFKRDGKSVMLAAGDTFRAAAIEQLQVWGDRNKVPVVTKPLGSDAAALAYEAIERAEAEKVDVLMIDTAGRLQNRKELMEELAKVIRVINKKVPDAPHDTLIILDATTGQNALMQVDAFKATANISGMIMTKLDGSARGGIMVAVADKFGLPIHAIGVGEGVDDLQPFDAGDFAKMLVGLVAK